MYSSMRVSIFAIAGFLTITMVGVATGQHGDGGDRDQKRWGLEATPRAGACFFEDSHFRGKYFCVNSNDDFDKLPRDMRDKISSLRVIGNVNAMVFKDEKFKGRSAHFLSDVSDLRKQGWNDQISSIRVTKTASTWDGGRFPGWGREAVPNEGACFYRDAGFKGDYFCMPRGASYALVPPGFNDKISSVRVIRGGGVLIFADRDFDGRVELLTSDVTDLRRGTWNDRISSIRAF